MKCHPSLPSAPPPISRVVLGAPAGLDLVFARALAKNRALRYQNARALGEAFRSALGLPHYAGWQAQADLSRVAKTLSMAMEQLQEPSQRALPPTADDTPALAPSGAAGPPAALEADARAEAERYATDVLTAFKKG